MANNLGFGSFNLENVFFNITSLYEVRQGISHSICFILTVIDFVLILVELLSLTNLPGASPLDVYKTTKVIMISEDKTFVFIAFKVMMPSLKSFNNS